MKIFYWSIDRSIDRYYDERRNCVVYLARGDGGDGGDADVVRKGTGNQVRSITTNDVPLLFSFVPIFEGTRKGRTNERTNEQPLTGFVSIPFFFHGYFSFTSNTPQVNSPASPWPISFLTFRKPFQVKTQPIKLSSLLFPLLISFRLFLHFLFSLFSPFSLFSFFFEILFFLFHFLCTSKVVFSLRSTFLDLSMLYVSERSYIDPWNLLLRSTSLRVLSFLLFANYLFYIYIYIYFLFLCVFFFSLLFSRFVKVHHVRYSFVVCSLFVPLESKKKFIKEIC